MPIDDLLSVLEAEVEAEIEAELRTARQRVEEIRARGQAEIGKQRGERLQQVRTRLEAQYRRQESRASSVNRRRTLEARQELLRRIFDTAAEILRRRADEEDQWVTALIPQMLPFLPPGPLRLRCPSSSTLASAREVPGSPTPGRIRLEPGPGSDFVLESADGSVAVDLTPQKRLALRESWLAIDILHSLESPTWHRSGEI